MQSQINRKADPSHRCAIAESGEPTYRSAVSQTAIDTPNSAFIEATGDAASTIGNARLRALQRNVAAMPARACLCVRHRAPEQLLQLRPGQFVKHENDVDRLPVLGMFFRLTSRNGAASSLHFVMMVNSQQTAHAAGCGIRIAPDTLPAAKKLSRELSGKRRVYCRECDTSVKYRVKRTSCAPPSWVCVLCVCGVG